jgi:small nuclear ribonucleoprotein B and B'
MGEEFRRTRRRGKAAPGATQTVTETEERRALGLSIIRGAQVISLSVDGPPPADPAARLGATASAGPSTAAALVAGPGVARQAERGLQDEEEEGVAERVQTRRIRIKGVLRETNSRQR